MLLVWFHSTGFEIHWLCAHCLLPIGLLRGDQSPYSPAHVLFNLLSRAQSSFLQSSITALHPLPSRLPVSPLFSNRPAHPQLHPSAQNGHSSLSPPPIFLPISSAKAWPPSMPPDHKNLSMPSIHSPYRRQRTAVWMCFPEFMSWKNQSQSNRLEKWDLEELIRSCGFAIMNELSVVLLQKWVQSCFARSQPFFSPGDAIHCVMMCNRRRSPEMAPLPLSFCPPEP